MCVLGVCMHVCLFVQALLSAHSGTAVMRSLGEVAEQEATEIRKLTTSLDPQQEAASLKCMCVCESMYVCMCVHTCTLTSVYIIQEFVCVCTK